MILVTGATSHTGSYLIPHLIDKDYSVRCLVRTQMNEVFIPKEKVQIARGDLEHPETVVRALNGVDTLVHVAHIRFASDIVPLCRQAGVSRAIFISSTRRFTKFPCESATQVIEGEDVIRKSGLRYTLLRPSMIYGGSRDNNMTKLVEQIRRHSIFPLFGKGDNLFQPVFVFDLVKAIIDCLENDRTINREYTLAGSEPFSYRDCVKTIALALNRKIHLVPLPLGLCLFLARIYEKTTRKPRFTAEQIQRFGEDKVFDIQPARDDFGFDPRPFSEGIRMKIAGEL
ncbi:NAD(P)H-binding protein [Candidatus Sumerlaeota bacterium]|nr:NAD(P)H-binding protein [Candidatus Sumerlaeota bacterium]